MTLFEKRKKELDKGKHPSSSHHKTFSTPAPSWEDMKAKAASGGPLMTRGDYGTLSTNDYELAFKEGKFERGETVPLSELPDELQENVKNPPPEVENLKKKMEEKKACGCDGSTEKEGKFERGEKVPLKDLPKEMQEMNENPPEEVIKVREEMESKKSATLLRAEDYEALLKAGRFEKGVKMTVDEVAEVVGPEFKEMNENPPDSVVKLREEMKRKAVSEENKEDIRAAIEDLKSSDRETRIESAEYLLANIIEGSFPSANLWRRRAEVVLREARGGKSGMNLPGELQGKSAASGLYGHTKEVEGCCSSASRKLQASTQKLAKALYAKDEESPLFLAEHGKRTGNRAAKLLVGAMKELGPGAALAKTASGRSGLYGFKERTAKLSLEACGEVYQQAGLIASDLHNRRTAQYEKLTGFFREHSKAAKCGYSALLLESYPTVSEGVKLAGNQKTANVEDPNWSTLLRSTMDSVQAGKEGLIEIRNQNVKGWTSAYKKALAALSQGAYRSRLPWGAYIARQLFHVEESLNRLLERGTNALPEGEEMAISQGRYAGDPSLAKWYAENFSGARSPTATQILALEETLKSSADFLASKEDEEEKAEKTATVGTGYAKAIAGQLALLISGDFTDINYGPQSSLQNLSILAKMASRLDSEKMSEFVYQLAVALNRELKPHLTATPTL
jgi:hypothetical protein